MASYVTHGGFLADGTVEMPNDDAQNAGNPAASYMDADYQAEGMIMPDGNNTLPNLNTMTPDQLRSMAMAKLQSLGLNEECRQRAMRLFDRYLAGQQLDPNDAAWMESITNGHVPVECLTNGGQNNGGSDSSGDGSWIDFKAPGGIRVGGPTGFVVPWWALVLVGAWVVYEIS